MNRTELIDQFRQENPEIPSRVVGNGVLQSWLLFGDKDFCAKTRCIVNEDPETISTTENDTNWDLTDEISKFYDIDEFPGGGVAYNDERLAMTTPAKLDQDEPGWRTASANVPDKYYRRLGRIYTNCPINSAADDLTVYAVLISDDFDSDGKIPYNQLTYLEPFHYGLALWLQWKAKAKVGKEKDAAQAMNEYIQYAAWAKREIGGGKFGPIYYQKSEQSTPPLRRR